MRRKLNLEKYYALLIQTGKECLEDKVPHLGAALAFYSMLSLGPLLLLVLAAASVIFGRDAARGRMVFEIQNMIGSEGARAVQAIIKDSAQNRPTGVFASLMGFGTLFFGAAGVFSALQDAMNTIWDIKPRPKSGWRGYLRDRFFSFSMVLGTGFLLLISLVISAALTALSDFSTAHMAVPGSVIQGTDFLISFGAVSLLFCMIFKYIPGTRVAWRDVRTGAVLTAFLFTLGKSVIGFYLGHSAFSSSYGAAGSLVVVLIWVYYSSQILFFGAEFTQVYANRYKSEQS
jgi:membrane protein